MWKALVGTACLCLMLVGCGRNYIVNPDGTKLDIRGAMVSGLDDPLEADVMVWVGYKDLDPGTNGSLAAYRGYIDKKTLASVYQLYIRTKSPAGFGYWDEARYVGPNGLLKYSLRRIDSKITYMSNMPFYAEDFILRLDSKIIKDMCDGADTLRLGSSRVSGNMDVRIYSGEAETFSRVMQGVVAILKANDRQK